MFRVMRFLAFVATASALAPVAAAQTAEAGQATGVERAAASELDTPWEGFSDVRVSLLAGLIQPLVLQGGNVELDLMYGRLVVGYSHGFLLNVRGDAVVGAAATQGLRLHLPFSTGLSVGYRFLEWLDARLEVKLHQFDVYREGNDTALFSYTTLTLGLGVYAQYRPFRDFGVQTNEWLHGFVIVSSVRYWPNLWTSLEQNRRTYTHPQSGLDEIHDAANIGIANTPFIVNVSLGYTVAF